MLRGEWRAARAVGDALPETSESVFLLVIARTYFAPLAHAQGAPELAWAQINAVVPYGPTTAPGNLLYDGLILPMQRLAVALALDAGDLALAREWLEAHDRWLAWNGAVLGQSEGHLLWARYFRAAGDPRDANDHARQALARATVPLQPLALLAAHRFLGELDTIAGRFAEAAQHLDRSLALTAACDAPHERALTLLALAELRAAQRKPADASTLLDDVRAICVPLDAKPTLNRVDAFAARLAAMKDAPPVYPAGLSVREVEVLRLLAAGKSNHEIADALFLSERTVNVHINHIYTKTRVDNRAAATAFAYEHDLV
jgi:DNA-binding CsgD family transcriptional regulator